MARRSRKISSAGHALSAVAGGCADQRGGAAPGDGDICHPGPGSIVANDPRVQQELVEIADRPASAKRRRPRRRRRSSSCQDYARRGRRARCARPASRRRRLRRGRRRPDPFVTVTALMRGWFEAEPWRTSRELFERLQAAHPGVYPDGQLRTLQRRLKDWRREMAHKMVFGAEAAGATPGQAPLSSNSRCGAGFVTSRFSMDARRPILDRQECATVLTSGKVRCSPSSPCSRERARCAWLRVAPLLPIPSAAAGAAQGAALARCKDLPP